MCLFGGEQSEMHGRTYKSEDNNKCKLLFFTRQAIRTKLYNKYLIFVFKKSLSYFFS
jgi:hypothetical protein